MLTALDQFYAGGQALAMNDFHHNDATQPIVISITYTKLPTEALELFDSYVANGELTVDLVVAVEDGKIGARYFGSKQLVAEFTDIRAASNAADRRTEYNRLREKTLFAELPVWSNQTQALQALDDWQQANPGALTRGRDDGQFFGFKAVARGYLGRFTRLLLIPAVRDAGQVGNDGKGSPLSQLMDLVVRSTLAQRSDIAAFKAEIQIRYSELLAPAAIPELSALQKKLSATLASFAPNTSIALKWQPLGALDVPMPTADVALLEDSYEARVDRVGHGLQRAFILTVLQEIALQPVAADSGIVHDPTLVIAFEEPELYQHPSRQRHIAAVLRRLVSQSEVGLARETQVIYTTHSPLLVGIDRFEDVRVLRRVASGADPARSATQITHADSEAVARRMEKAFAQPIESFSTDGERARMRALMTPMVNEGFFADFVVLVEGESDRAALCAEASRIGFSLDGTGCAIIPCIGKSGILRPYAVFRSLGIPIFVVWDGDKGGRDNPNPCDNHRIQRSLDAPEVDWPPFTVTQSFACYETNLEDALKADLGEDVFSKHVDAALSQFGLTKRKDGMKNPLVMQAVLESATRDGRTAASLNSIVEAIRNMTQRA